jgi:N-methylhydantoinase B/oxoprolinase/acetone carboxylase alpha subunit
VRRKVIYKSKGFRLEPGDMIIVETDGGGGYGSPCERPRELVEHDVLRGYVSARQRSWTTAKLGPEPFVPDRS